MRLSLLVLLALALAGCGGRQLGASAGADSTTACCDSVALANCCPGDSTADCGGCATPASPADPGSGAAEPCPPGG